MTPFQETVNLVNDLLENGKIKKTCSDGQYIVGIIDNVKVKFIWEIETYLISTGEIQSFVSYDLYLNNKLYIGNDGVSEESKEELKTLYLIKEKISRKAIQRVDKSDIIKYMNKRKRKNEQLESKI